jgi:cobalt-zinc-cadmium efflux system protein
VLVVALAGIGVNLLATWQLAGANRTSLNVRASYAHILTDLYAFIGTAVAAVVILATGFTRADAIASLGVAILMLHASAHLLREALRVLLEAAPQGMSPREIGESLEGHPCVTNVHDLHVWEITSGFPALSAHVLVRPGDDCHAIREDLERLLRDRFGIDHTTLQVDHDQRGRLLSIEERPAPRPGAR